MKSFIRFNLRQSVLYNVVFVALVVFSAVFALPDMPIDRYPNIAFGEAIVQTRYPGASPEEVERLVTDVIEESLRGMEDLEYVRSRSIAGESQVYIKFDDDTDYDGLYDELRFRVLAVQNQLPIVNGDPLTPRINEVDVDEWLPVVQVNLIAADPAALISKRSLALLAKDLRDEIEQIDGVKSVIIAGEEAEQFVVALNPARLEQHRLTVADVVASLRDAGVAPPAGIVDTGYGERLIRVDNRFRTRDDVLTVVLRVDGAGNRITVGDLVDHDDTGMQRIEGSVIATVNGRDTVACKVLKKRSANSIRLKGEIDGVIERFIAANSRHQVAAVATLDSSVEIRNGLGVLADNLMLSVVLVLALLFLFMSNRSRSMTIFVLFAGLAAAFTVGLSDNFTVKIAAIAALTLFVFFTCRAAILTVSGIVFSFLGSLMVFHLLDKSINELSLLGFVLVIGIVVDDAIVVIENIQRLRETGKSLMSSVVDGTAEVFLPVFSATLTTMAAFLPLLLMTGSVGDFFSLVPIAVCVALAISLVECLIVLPLHVVDLERLLGPDRSAATRPAQGLIPVYGGITGRFSRIYDRLLRWNLSHPYLTVTFSAILFFLAVGIIIVPAFGYRPILKVVFFPDDTSKLVTSIRMPAGAPLAETDRVVRDVSRFLVERGTGFIANTTGTAGMLVDRNYKPLRSRQYGSIQVELPPREIREFDDSRLFIRELRAEVEAKFEHNGVDLELTAAPDGPPIGEPVNVRVAGRDDATVFAAAEALLAHLNAESGKGGAVQGLIDIRHDRNLLTEVVSFHPDRDRVSLFDLRERDVQAFVADALDGAYVGDYRRIDKDVPVRVRMSRLHIREPADILGVPIANDADGRLVRFGDVGTISVSQTPATLVRRDFRRVINVVANLHEDAPIGAVDAARHIRGWFDIHADRFPGVTIAFGGESESTAKSYRSLALAFGIAIVLIYTVLATQFNSYLQPFLIMSNIIFSFTGVILVMSAFSIAVRMMPEGSIAIERSLITVQGFIAIVGLTGLVINDGIVLIDFINQRLADGLPLREALVTAGHQRMRPIFMTTATTIAGLLPMAIGIPAFNVTWGPFATCFIAGLTVSTTMTLLVVPVLFEILESLRRRPRAHATNAA